MTREFLHPYDNAVVRHPSAALYDAVFTASSAALSVYAERKKVALRDDECAPVLRHAMEHLSRKTLRRIVNGNEDAIRSIQLAINHSLDVLAMVRLIAIGRGISNLPPLDATTLVLGAEEALRNRFANDKAPTMQIWGDPVEMTADYVRLKLAEEDRPPLVTLCESAYTRAVVRLPLRGGRT